MGSIAYLQAGVQNSGSASKPEKNLSVPLIGAQNPQFEPQFGVRMLP